MSSILMTDSRPLIVRKAGNRWFLIAAGSLIALMGLGWVGLQIVPAPFLSVAMSNESPGMFPLPAGLPVPVERFYRTYYGDQIPEIRSAVISGRATMRIAPLFNLTFPARYRFIHEAGQSYRHYIEITFLGLPILKVNEYYVGGVARMELPWEIATGSPKLDQGANVGMWAEIIEWLPSVLLTDSRVRWEAIDDGTAFLVLPFGDGEERFVVRFNPIDGSILYWEVMRYADGEGEKTLWINGIWFEDGSPWLVMMDEDVVYNVDVETSFTKKGP